MNCHAILASALTASVAFAQDIPVGFALKQESEHFKIFSQQEDSSISDIVKRSESMYQQVTKDLAFTPTDKINVIVFPSVAAYHTYRGFASSTPTFIICGHLNSDVFLVSPTNSGPYHDYKNSILFLGVSVASAIMSGVPKKQVVSAWFEYGFGFYETLDDRMRSVYAKKVNLAVSKGRVLTLNEYDPFSEFHGPCAYNLVAFLIQQHGMSAVQALIRDFLDFKNIVGISQEVFYAQWLEHVKKQFSVQKDTH